VRVSDDRGRATARCAAVVDLVGAQSSQLYRPDAPPVAVPTRADSSSIRIPGCDQQNQQDGAHHDSPSTACHDCRPDPATDLPPILYRPTAAISYNWAATFIGPCPPRST